MSLPGHLRPALCLLLLLSACAQRSIVPDDADEGLAAVAQGAFAESTVAAPMEGRGGVTVWIECDPRWGQVRSLFAAVHVDMTNALPPAERLGSLGATLRWDPIALGYRSHSTFPEGFTGAVNIDNVSEGRLDFNLVNPSGVVGQAVLFKVVYDIESEPHLPIALDLEVRAMASAMTFQDLLPFSFVEGCRWVP